MVYKCQQCLWQGVENQLCFDVVETCMGADKVEVCPLCGSLNIRFSYSVSNN